MIKNIYVLYYRSGNNPNPMFFFFEPLSKDIRQIVDRCKKHCELMNYRFVNVRPAFVDMDSAELLLLGRSSDETVGVTTK